MENLKLIKIFIVAFCFLFQFNFLIVAVKGQNWDEDEACQLREIQGRDRCEEKADQKHGDCRDSCLYPDNILDEDFVACSNICLATWHVDFDRCYANMSECVMPDEDKEYIETDNTKYNEDQNNLIGLPIDLNTSTSPCIGEAPKNSEVCLGDDEKVFYYTQKELVGSCSVPEGSEPKCECVCKSGYDFIDGECKDTGFFARIISWLGSLF